VQASRSNLLCSTGNLSFYLCLLVIVGGTKIGFLREGSCFPVGNFADGNFCFIYRFLLFFITSSWRKSSRKWKTTKYFVIFNFLPPRLFVRYCFCCWKKKKKIEFHIVAVLVYQAIFVEKMSGQFICGKFEMTRSSCVDILCFMKNKWDRKLTASC